MSRAPELAPELVRLDVDVIFAAVQPEARAAHEAAGNAGRTIPIVFGPVGDPVEDGLVASLARPGELVSVLTEGNEWIFVMRVMVPGQRAGRHEGYIVMLTPFQYVRMVLTAYSHLDQWFCEPCLGAAVRKVGGDVDSLTLHEVTEQIRGTKGMEYGVDRCPRCHSVTSLIRFAGSKQLIAG